MDAALFEALKTGSAAPGLSEQQRLTVAYVDNLVVNVRASDTTFHPALTHFGAEKLQELTLLTGCYMMVCRFLQTFDVDIEQGGAKGLNMDARIPDV